MKNLREIMKDRHLTVEELAAKSKLPPTSIKQLIDRSRIANIEEILRLADALDLSVNDLGKMLVQDDRFEKFRKRSNRGFSYKKFEEQLRKKQLNPARLSDLTGIHFGTILCWKNLNNQPSKENIQLIANTLGCSTNDLCEIPNENECSTDCDLKPLSQDQMVEVKEFDSDALLHFFAVHRLTIQKISQVSQIPNYRLSDLRMGSQICRYELDRLCDCLNVSEKIFTERNDLTACARKCYSKYDPRIFSKAFLFLTKKYSISQYSLSAILDINFGTIKHWVSGKGTPKIEQAILISEFFNVLPNFFLMEPESFIPDFIKENHLFENESEPLFAKRLRQILQEKKLTQAELVRRARTNLIKVDIASMARFCCGKRVPGKRITQRLAEVLEVDPEWLAGELTFNPLAFKQKIKASGLSALTIADSTGISQSKIKYLSKSAQHPDKKELEKIAIVLRCSVEDFYKKKLDDGFIHRRKFNSKAFKKCLKDSGYSVKKLSAKSEIPYQTIYRWISDTCICPNLELLNKATRILNHDVEDFFFTEIIPCGIELNKPIPFEFNIEFFKQKLKESHKSSHKISIESRISYTVIWRWIKGKCKPTYQSLKKVAAVLGCDAKDFYSSELENLSNKPTQVEKEREINTMSNKESKIQTSEYTPEKLRLAMKKDGFTIKSLADKINMSTSTVSHWTCGERVPSPQAMSKLFEILDFSIDDSETETSRFNNETFKQHLEASGLSIYEISKKSGVNRSTIYNWCCGRAKNPAMKHLKPVASLLNCPIDVFYDPITSESESQPIKVEEVPSCEPTILPQSPADSPSFILTEEDLEPGVVQTRLSINEKGRKMTFRKLFSVLERTGKTIPEFAYETGFSKSEIELWKRSPKELSEEQLKTISEFLKVDPESLPTSVKELEMDKSIQKLINDLPKWSYQDLEKLLDFIIEMQLDFEFRMF